MLKPIFGALVVAAWLAFRYVVSASAGPGRSTDRRAQGWPYYGGDQAGTKVLAADGRQRFDGDAARRGLGMGGAREGAREFGTRPGVFQTTPLMIDNVLYFSTP